MYECPVCQSMMEEETSLVTECCGTPVDEDSDEALEECPGCGQADPELIEGPTRLVCENCGYSE